MKNPKIVLRRLHFSAEKSLKFLLFSDLHFDVKLKNSLLEGIIKTAKKSHPDYILFGGDLVDMLDSIVSESEESRLVSFLVRLSLIAPIFLCIGNHDYYRTISKRDITFKRKRLKNILKGHENIHLLMDEAFEDKNVYIFGCALPPEYYHPDPESHRHFVREDKAAFTKLLDSYKNLAPPENKVSFFLVHSPVFLKDADVKEKLHSFDFTVSGHMHMGCVPPLIEKIWPGDRGFISPEKRLFPHQARSRKNDRNIILPAVRTVVCSKILNSPFSPTLTILNTKK